MLWGASLGALELRSEGGATRLRALFPYGAETELAPGRREAVAPGAFASRIEAGEDIHLLLGHDYAKPLASREARSLVCATPTPALRSRPRSTPARAGRATFWRRTRPG
jgi:uncharacterized protein